MTAPRPKKRALPRGDEGGDRRRFQRLDEVSKLLLRFESPAPTIAAVFAAMHEALGLHSAVVLYDEGGALQCHAWPAEAANAGALALAEAHARHCYAYLAGAAAGSAPGAPGVVPFRAPARPPASPPELTGGGVASVVALPLVVGRRRVFGAVQLAVDGRLDEAGLLFANAVVNQLALALDRHSALRAERARADDRRREFAWRLEAHAGSLARADRARELAETARELAETARDRYGARLDFSRAVTDSLGEGVVAVDRDARITFFNPAAERLLGWAEAEALGAFVPELLRLRRLDGTDVPADDCPLVRVLQTGEAVHGDDVSFLGRDDAPFPVSYTSAPLAREGRVSGAVLVFQNVIALKRSENAQHFLAEVSAALAASLDGEQALATAARLAVPLLADACRLEELADDGSVLRVAFAADDDRAPDPGGPGRFEREPAWREARAAALATGRPQRRADLAGPAPAAGDAAAPPRAPFASLMVVPLRARGRPLGLLSLATLDRARRYAEADLAFAEELAHRAAMALDNARSYEAMRRAVRQRQDVLAVVSHDLRNPLSAILMGATFLSERGDDDPAQSRRKMFEMVARSVTKMDRMLKDLLDMSSIDAGRLSLDRRPHPLIDLVEGALETLLPVATRASVRLEFVASPAGLVVACDRWRVMQVLSNLVGNAIKFSPPGGTVALRAERRGPDVRFAVTDEGPGIAPERLPHVFERYWQAQETASKGTGLGLYISKGIVESHGGRLGVESDVGRGATFFFTLPLLPPAAADAPAPAPAPEPAPPAAPPPPRPSDLPAPPSLLWPSPPPARR